MTTQAWSLTQKLESDDLIRKILDMETMTREAYSYLWEIEDGYRDDINTMKINNFCTSIASIIAGHPQFPWTTCLGMTTMQPTRRVTYRRKLQRATNFQQEP